MSIVSLKNVNKVYPNGAHAVYDFNIDIEPGEFIVMAGPSGCGKSTTLRMIAGLEEISSGDLIINGKRCNDLAPRDRDIAMVFQNYALYAHMTVYHNLAFSLMIRKIDSDEIHKRVMAAAEILGLVPYLNRKPKQLSGGQRQRVAVGRAIVRNPVVYLLDEPLSNLDAKLRASMRKELSQLHHQLNATFIYVTHDQIEALTLADRIVVMKDGWIQQCSTPKEMFDKPANLFVAGFIGTPPMNFYHGMIDEEGYFNQGSFNSNGEFVPSESQTRVLLVSDMFDGIKSKGYVGKEVVMASRPDYVYMDDESLATNSNAQFTLDFEYEEHLGAYNLVYGNIGEERCIAKVYGRDEAVSEKITCCFDMSKVHFFDVETENRIND